MPPLHRLVSRAGQLAPHAAGLGVAALLLWQGGGELERQAAGSEAFSVHVDQPAGIVDTGAADPPAPWRAQVRPSAELERLTVEVDGRPVNFDGRRFVRDLERGELSLALEELAPGWHFVDLDLERRGGRHEGAVAPVLVGDFGPSPLGAPSEGGEGDARSGSSERPCAMSLRASEALLQSLVRPMLERELMPKLRAVEPLGPDTELRAATLELHDDALRFELEIAGVNTLTVSGVIALWIDADGLLQAKLVTLGAVDFRGKLRDQARGAAAGGGALVAGIVAPPLAPVGAALGWWLADDFVTDKARELVREEVDAGLEEISGVALLPERVALIPGEPRSEVRLGFCADTRVRETGVVAGLWLAPATPPDPSPAPRFDLGVPGPLVVRARLSQAPLGEDEDLRVELGVDLLNALLLEWTASGLLAQQLREGPALTRANEELERWTPLRLAGLVPTRPPALTPAGGPATGWNFGVGGLEIALTGMDPEAIDARWGTLSMAATGSVALSWDADAGELALAASLDRLALTCVHAGAPQTDAHAHTHAARSPARIDGCFAEILDAVELQERLDAHLRPDAAALPRVALASLLSDELGLSLDSLSLSRPDPAVLRLSAQVHPRPLP